MATVCWILSVDPTGSPSILYRDLSSESFRKMLNRILVPLPLDPFGICSEYLCIHRGDPQRRDLGSPFDFFNIFLGYAKLSCQCSFCQIVVDPELPEEVGKAVNPCKWV